MRTLRKLLITIVLLSLSSLNVVSASAPKDFELQFHFPVQGMPVGSSAAVEIDLGGQDWTEADIVTVIQPVLNVVPTSNVDAISVNPRTHIAKSGVGVVLLPIQVRANGEFEVLVEVRLKTNGRNLFRSRTMSVLAENGIVWFGDGAIGGALEAKIRSHVETKGGIPHPQQDAAVRELLKEEEEKRVGKAAKNSPRAEPRSSLRSPDQTLVIRPLWRGRTQSGFLDIPFDGARITVSDKALGPGGTPLTPDIVGYIDNGTFSFSEPRANYSYKVTIESEFPGIQPNGALQLSGNGIGAFSLVRRTAAGNLYACIAENTTNVVCDLTACADDECVRAWSAFHGMAELVVQANSRLGAAKRPGMKVVFASSGSFQTPGQNQIDLVARDAYDWDVVAHEFGHIISEEQAATNIQVGGPHNWENQYDYLIGNGLPASKDRAVQLAMNEGFGTWFGVALTHGMRSAYSSLQGVNDKFYTDTEDASVGVNLEANAAPLSTCASGCPFGPFYGEDTELAIARLLYDIADTNDDGNTNAPCEACKDVTTYSVRGLWDVLKGSSVKNIVEVYTNILDRRYQTAVAQLHPQSGSAVQPGALAGALALSSSFAEFGMAPYLEAPRAKTKIDLLSDTPTPGPTFRWKQSKTGSLQGLTKFALVLYSADRTKVVLNKSGLTGSEYTLTSADIVEIRDHVEDSSAPQTAVVATVIGEGDPAQVPQSGPYVGNAVELLLSNPDRTLVVVVDSSGSNLTTDPQNLRVSAARSTLSRLKSAADVQATNGVSDLAGAVEFDDSATVLSQLDDPDAVIPRLNGIDSAGGTDIAAGINAATQILENLNTSGVTGLLRDKSSIVVFTDGENNAGPLPVIQAIAAATLKGVRVHLGFLQPRSANRGYFIPSDAPPGYVAPTRGPVPDGSLPPTVAEAVLASGGVYAIIGDAESQVAFSQQIEDRGFTNGDATTQGVQRVIGQTETFDVLGDGFASKAFKFRGALRESARVVVNTLGNFRPLLVLEDREGNVLASVLPPAGDDMAELVIVLPYSGEYSAIVSSADGRSGLFSVFVDVENPAGGPVVPATPVPTLSVIAMGLCMTALVLLGLLAVRRRTTSD